MPSPQKKLNRFAILLVSLIGIGTVFLPYAMDAQRKEPSISLKMKFRQGEINKYQTTMRMLVALPFPGQTKTNSSESVMDMTLVQETKKLLPEGHAEVLASVVQQSSTQNGRPVQAAPIDPVSYIFDSQGKVITPKHSEKSGSGTGGSGIEGISSLLNGTGTAGVGILLPAKSVAIGEHWKYPISAPGIIGNGTASAAVVKMENVGKYKTARIHSVVQLPIHFMADQQGAVVMSRDKAAVEAIGTGSVTTDYNFAVAEGKLIRSSGVSSIAMKFNPKFSKNGKKITKPSAALDKFMLNMTIKMQMGMNLIN